jgi:SAM-dependent methyltransferase
MSTDPRPRAQSSRRWPRRAVQTVLLAGLAADTVQLRRRAASLRVLAEDAAPPDDGYRLLKADGVRLDPQAIAAGRAHARAEGLAALDLVPRDLPVAKALDLLREVDPATYRSERLAPGRGACHAMLADEGVLRAAGISCNGAGKTAFDLAAATVSLKLHASVDSDLVVAPRLITDHDVVVQAPQVAVALHGPSAGLVLGFRIAWMVTLFASGALGRVWAAVVAGAWAAQPLAVFAGSLSLAPVDLWSYSATRFVQEPRYVIAALRATRRLRTAHAEAVELRRPAYQAQLAAGTEQFFEPRRTSCPWCGSPDLRVRLQTTDLFQFKPGQFTLEQCQRCGHIFQNPRLNPDGLSFYYRDFYDGLGEPLMDRIFSASADSYRSRADALKPFARPESWLDVGTGHGHFCNVAGETWPQTAFDGLDMADGIELAERRGWVRQGHRGMFTAHAPALAGAYDVVSMFHYLEHTPDPHLELEAARTVLRSGGHLLIDVPDPESRWSKLLGRRWMPWFQPQHLHLIPVHNLRRRLEEFGFTIVLEQHAEANVPVDLLMAALMTVGTAAPSAHLPWLPHSSRRKGRLARLGVATAALPLLCAAGIADRLIEPLSPRIGLVNAYRILARKV